MHVGKMLFAQIMDFLPWTTFNRIVTHYRGDHRVRTLSCAEQFRCIGLAQLTYRESLRDLRGSIPSFIHISDGKLHDVNVLDLLIPEAGAFYVMDRGYLDFERLHALAQMGAFFVAQARSNMDTQHLYSALDQNQTTFVNQLYLFDC